MTIEDLLKQFTQMVENGLYILPPDDSCLFNYKPLLQTIDKTQRDKFGIVGQLQNGSNVVEGGDSAHKTGVLAFCNSLKDQQNLDVFENNGIMVRHPFEGGHNSDPSNCSRDQLLAYAAGCWRAKKYKIVERLIGKCIERAKNGIPLCQNGDVLMPHNMMFLKICSGDKEAYLDLLGQAALQIEIESNDPDVEFEKNQPLLMSIVCGRLNLFTQINENYKENIRAYWFGDWRHQDEIGEALICTVELELRRYSGQNRVPIFGIPAATLNMLFNMLKDFHIENFPNYVIDFLKALASDIQRDAKQVFEYINNIIKNPFSIFNIPFMTLPFIPLQSLLNNLLGGNNNEEIQNQLEDIRNNLAKLNKEVEDISNLCKQILDIVKGTVYETTYLDYYTSMLSNFTDFKVLHSAYLDLSEAKGIKIAKETYAQRFMNLGVTLTKDIAKYDTLIKGEYSYATLPILINYMNMHVTAIILSGDNVATIRSVLENLYKEIFNGIVTNKNSNSLLEKIATLKSIQEKNLNYIDNLFSISFNVSSYLKGKKEVIQNIVETTDGYIKGKYKITDYLYKKVYDEDKIENIKQLIESGLIEQSLLPQFVYNEVTAENEFEETGYKVKLSIKPDKFNSNIELSIDHIWSICQTVGYNQDAPLYPHLNQTELENKSKDIMSIGEELISNTTLLYSGLTSLKRIDELIENAKELIKK